MSKIILSICIPTYNRGEILYKTVNHILASPRNDIEIFVSDNASSDNTEELMRKIKDLRVNYHRRPKNYGAESNFINCIRRATGKYVFFIADDDIVEIKEIPWLIDTIKNNNNFTF